MVVVMMLASGSGSLKSFFTMGMGVTIFHASASVAITSVFIRCPRILSSYTSVPLSETPTESVKSRYWGFPKSGVPFRRGVPMITRI